MEQPTKQETVYQLSSVQVESVGLVRRGANRKPFYFIKSEEGGSDMPKDENIQDFSEILTELENVEEINETAWQKLVSFAKSLVGMIPQEKPEPEPEPEGDEDTVDLEAYAETLRKEMREEFAEQLAGARKIAEDERHLRRLREFCDTVEEFSALTLPDAGEGDQRDQFAQDLMEIHDKCGAEVYGRVMTVLRASDKQISEGELFAQYASARKPNTEGKHPFEAKVEQIRVEKFGDLPKAEGFTKAMEIAQQENPELARQYAMPVH